MNTLNELQTSKKELENLMNRVNSACNYIGYLKESSSYVTPEDLYNYIQRIVAFVNEDLLVMELLQSKQQMRGALFDVQSMVETCVLFSYKFHFPYEDDDKVIFLFLLLKYIIAAYKRFTTIFDAIYAYCDKDVLLDPRYQKHSKVKDEIIRKSSTRNFILEVILPFLSIVELYLLNLKMAIENKKPAGISINVHGSIGNNVLIGDFSNNQGDINSDLVINPELALSKDELDDIESINEYDTITYE
ncbi:hypothetical protein [Thermoactinomyces sp. CICC 10522]|uniref:hypothetical protein n=1 Tax=Thermoactinomyces sp. CICC 10522 TaxID=2767427 RepID=UPI0018DDABC4|nr:hypothetical protein [Thermoactinomyces sp. CICC 10522]MBH8605526.1 hypothetical protein [Thermoactinomyces sp. CICC 10522]